MLFHRRDRQNRNRIGQRAIGKVGCGQRRPLHRKFEHLKTS
jgi:hypothetical protein